MTRSRGSAHRLPLAAVAITAALAVGIAAEAGAQPAQFQGKTVRIIVGFQPGGGYDL